MKKYFFLLTLFLLTGCSAEYNLVYENNILSESLKVTSTNNETINQESFYDLVNDYYENDYTFIDYRVEPGDMDESEALSTYKYYNKELLNYNNKYGIELNYNFSKINEYNNSSIVFSLFDNFYVTDERIRAYDHKDIYGKYSNLDNITITFKTDKKVAKTNCDEEKDGVYYWYLDRYNYLNKDISIDLKSDNKEEKVEVDDKFTKNFILILIILIITIAIFITYKIRKSNN